MKHSLEMGVETELSPLDQIQRTEAEVMRRVAAAKEAARLVELKAHEEAEAIMREAQNSGQREGEAQYENIVAAAQVEAEVLLEDARQRAEDLRRSGESRMATAVRRAVNILIGIEEEANHV